LRTACHTTKGRARNQILAIKGAKDLELWRTVAAEDENWQVVLKR